MDKQTGPGPRQNPSVSAKHATTKNRDLPNPKSLEEIVILANKVGLEYVEAKKVADRLELLKPSYKARAMVRYDNGEIPETKIRRMAETDEEYIGFLESLAEAKLKSDQLRIKYESYKNLFEARRSLLSYQKAEMKLI